MKKATSDIAKSPRPKGTGAPVLVRLQPALAARIDTWRRSEDDLPNRAEAIRRLVEHALIAEKPKRKVKP